MPVGLAVRGQEEEEGGDGVAGEIGNGMVEVDGGGEGLSQIVPVKPVWIDFPPTHLGLLHT